MVSSEQYLLKKHNEKCPGAPLFHFRCLFKKAEQVLKLADYPQMASPYSIIPLISQAIGLEVPMMGTGKSPYSIISYFSKLDEDIFWGGEDVLPYEKRREMIDEIYDMIAPYLLDEQEEYIELLIGARFKRALLGFSKKDLDEFGKIFRKKFKILDRFLSKITFVGGNFSHVAHYGYPEDLYREQGFLRNFDDEAARLWCENSYPVVVEMQLDGYDQVPNKCIRGWYVWITNCTEDLIKSKAVRQKKLLQAGRLAKALNSKFAGMAGLIASFSKGGQFFVDNVNGFGFTTGHAYTVANIYGIVRNIVKKVSMELSESKVAVVGAAGSIGSGISKMIAEHHHLEELILIDMPNIISSRKLEKLEGIIHHHNPNIPVRLSKQVGDIVKADLIIVATNSPVSLIKSDHLKPGAVVIDDSFPKNVSRNILEERADIILLEGGVTQMPVLNIDVSRHMPDLLDLSISKLISCSQAYGCLAETFILAALGHEGNYGLGDSDPELARDILEKGKRLGFVDAVFQNYGSAIEESRIELVKNIIKNRKTSS